MNNLLDFTMGNKYASIVCSADGFMMANNEKFIDIYKKKNVSTDYFKALLLSEHDGGSLRLCAGCFHLNKLNEDNEKCNCVECNADSSVSLFLLVFKGRNTKFVYIFNCADELLSAKREIEIQSSEANFDDEISLIHESRVKTLGFITAGLLHEINNPVGFITSNIQCLKTYLDEIYCFIDFLNECRSPQDREHYQDLIDNYIKSHRIELIKKESLELVLESEEGMARVIDIISSVKEFSRRDDEIHTTEDVSEPVSMAIKFSKGFISNKLIIENTIKDNSVHVKMFKNQISQVILNLIINASQAMPEFGMIVISLRNDSKYCTLEIKDNGKGIPESIQHKVFNKFYTTKKQSVGTGLGLAISKQIIENHGGKIWFTSKENEGTTFFISLPVANKK